MVASKVLYGKVKPHGAREVGGSDEPRQNQTAIRLGTNSHESTEVQRPPNKFRERLHKRRIRGIAALSYQCSFTVHG